MQSSRKEWEDMVNFQAAVIQVFARPDDQVCDMMIHGHLCCAQNDVRNIYPFATVDSLMLRSQVDQVLDVIESSRTNLVFGNIFPPEMVRRLPELGFRRVPKFSDRLTSTWYRPTPDRPVPDGIELAPREKPVNSGIQPVGAR